MGECTAGSLSCAGRSSRNRVAGTACPVAKQAPHCQLECGWREWTHHSVPDATLAVQEKGRRDTAHSAELCLDFPAHDRHRVRDPALCEELTDATGPGAVRRKAEEVAGGRRTAHSRADSRATIRVAMRMR